MFCDVCGHPLNENGFCPICGWAISAVQKDSMTQELAKSQVATPVQAYNQQVNNQQGYNQQTYNQQAYNQQAYNQQAYNQQTYNQQAYNQQAYNQQAYNQQAYNQQAYNQQAYNQQAYNQQAYNQQAYNQQAYNDGYNQPVTTKSKLPLIIGIIAGIAVLIAIIVVIVHATKTKDYTKDKDKTTTEDTTEFTTEATTTEATTTEAPPIDAEAGTKTIMIYMVGSNLESEYGAASEDISEMLYADYDSDKIKIVIYTGGSYDWSNSDIPDDGNSIILLEDGDLTVVEEDDDENMGEPETLSDFLDYSYTNFPAEQYSLILWNHGGGAFWGFGHDELTDDSLYLDELDEAFANSPFVGDNKLEWIGFDACLMATIETAHTLSPYANYMISSQESEPGWGWDYTFLEDIEDAESGKEVGTAIVDYYIDYCESSFDAYPYSESNVTLSVLDLSEIENVEAALNDLFAKANDDLTADTYPTYSRIRSKTKEIASEFTGEYSYDVVDLVDLTSNMETLFPDEAANLNNALKNLVVYNDANAVKSHGVSIYYPYNAKDGTAYYIPTYASFDFATEYTSFITNFSVLLTGEDTLSADWDPSTLIPVANGDYTFSMSLTPEQAANTQNVYYVISRADVNTPGNYVFVSMSNQVSMDNDYNVTANFDGNIIYMQNNTTLENYEVMYTEQEATDTYTRYLLSSILYDEAIDEEEAMYAYFVMETSDAYPQGQILGAYPIANFINSDGTDLFPERYEIDIYDYNYIAFGSFTHAFTSDEDLTNFNEADWSDLVLHYNSLPVTDGFSTVLGGMIPDVPYFGMFIIEDLQGNRHSSGLVQIQ